MADVIVSCTECEMRSFDDVAAFKRRALDHLQTVPARLVLDLRSLKLATSTFAQLVLIHRKCLEIGSTLLIVGMSPTVSAVFAA